MNKNIVLIITVIVLLCMCFCSPKPIEKMYVDAETQSFVCAQNDSLFIYYKASDSYNSSYYYGAFKLKKNATIDLAHELCHAFDSDRGLMDSQIIQDVSHSDYQAVYRENRIRGQLGIPLRTHYYVGVDPSGNPIGGTGPSMLTPKNQPIRPDWY